eukprot:snap_masked-scaffold_26-processed-gene-0.36-mRNA-1 protein AED:1.00 eAED:1.00 QI:0/0/0/0/1/1/2/0/59
MYEVCFRFSCYSIYTTFTFIKFSKNGICDKSINNLKVFTAYLFSTVVLVKEYNCFHLKY